MDEKTVSPGSGMRGGPYPSWLTFLALVSMILIALAFVGLGVHGYFHLTRPDDPFHFVFHYRWAAALIVLGGFVGIPMFFTMWYIAHCRYPRE